MTTLVLESDPVVIDINFSDDQFQIKLGDGRTLTVPLSWYPRLLHATTTEKKDWNIIGDGYAIEWPQIDEHIGIEGLLAGNRSGESEKSFQKWLTRHSQGKALFKSITNYTDALH